jgi:hypothetical protein
MTANLSQLKTIKITFLAAQLQTAYSVVSQIILFVYDLEHFLRSHLFEQRDNSGFAEVFAKKILD